jgi:phosphoglycerate dehydrogenase-like enzyme
MDTTHRALFLWDVPKRLREYIENGLSNERRIKLVFPSTISDEALFDHSSDAEIMIGWRPPEGLLENASKLKLFINPGAGVQHHIQRFRKLNEKREVVLVNGHGNSYFTAQHAVALLLALMNKIIPHHNWMQSGRWRTGDKEAKSIPLRYRRIGLLGYGAVNSKVHRFLSGFNVDFSVLKRKWKDKETKLPTEIEKFSPPQLHQFLEHIDTLIIAVPYTSDTIGLISKKELQLLGPDGLLVNVSRGIVVDEKSLYESLKNGIISGAAIDVWYNYHPEPDSEGKKFPYDYPFHKLDNIVLSPHHGGSPFDDMERWNEVIENIERFVSGRKDYLNIVNLAREY